MRAERSNPVGGGTAGFGKPTARMAQLAGATEIPHPEDKLDAAAQAERIGRSPRRGTLPSPRISTAARQLSDLDSRHARFAW